MKSVTHDSISLRGAGVVSVTQPRKGFRFTLDSILLSDFCRIKSGDRVLEPGAGTGVISLLLAKKFPAARFIADEVEPVAYRLLCSNIEENGLTGRIIPEARDLGKLGGRPAPNAFTVIVANPPYTRSGAGKGSPSAERQAARHDGTASLRAWLDLHSLLANRGRYFLVFPASRAAELISLLKDKKLEPKRIRFVHPFEHKPASLLLLEAVKSAGPGLEVMPPLMLHEKGGGPSDELRQIYDLP